MLFLYIFSYFMLCVALGKYLITLRCRVWMQYNLVFKVSILQSNLTNLLSDEDEVYVQKENKPKKQKEIF